MLYINNAGLEYTIIGGSGRNTLIKFNKSGSVRCVSMHNVTKGKVRDLYAPSRYGIGYDGDSTKVPYWKRAKDLWSNMLKRCYCEKDPKGYFGKVVVDARWHCFANFLEDLPKLIGFEKWLNKENMQLDKDYLSDSKVYSLHTCCFLSEFKNKSIQPNYREGKAFCAETRQWITTTL